MHRYFGEIFFTWNESKDQLHAILQTINARQGSELPMTITMNDTIDYLDLKLSQTDGHLRIEVAHDLSTEPYTLPYVFGYSKHHSRTWPRAAFIRAVRCCASVFDFANELEDMQLSFEHNRFDKDYFINEFHQFLKEFDSIQLKNLLCGEAYYNQSLYDYLREVAYNDHQTQKRLKIKRCQRQTIQYRWKYPLSLTVGWTSSSFCHWLGFRWYSSKPLLVHRSSLSIFVHVLSSFALFTGFSGKIYRWFAVWLPCD